MHDSAKPRSRVSLATLPHCRPFGCVNMVECRSDSRNEVTINTGAQRVDWGRKRLSTQAQRQPENRSGHALIMVLKSGVSIGTAREIARIL